MGFDLATEATPQHIDSHKTYVQSWVQAIREKPETLVKAIKDAQSAANYMDWMAELITDKEYESLESKAFEKVTKNRERAMER